MDNQQNATESPKSDDYLAFSIDRTPSTSVKYQPYNKNQWNNNRNNFRGRGLLNFSPQGFSSPITNRPNNFRGGGGGNKHFYQNNRQQQTDGSEYNNNRSFHRGRGGGGGGRSNQHSFNNSFSNNHNHHNKQRFNQNNYNKNNEIDKNIQSYVHPSMTEDPWKHFDLTNNKNMTTQGAVEDDNEENLNSNSLNDEDDVVEEKTESESISTN